MFVELLTAVSLLLVIEGLMPFLNPGRFRKVLSVAAAMKDRDLRLMGLGAMIAGVLLLYAVR